jgi:hypothetical protein
MSILFSPIDTVQLTGSSVIGPARIAVSACSGVLRRSSARERASSSRGENGLVM